MLESSLANAAREPAQHFPRTLAAWAIIFVGLLCLYGPALNGQLLWDDNDNITKPELRTWAGVPQIWFHWGATQTYYPVLHTLYWVEQKLWGDATLGYHVASILFHSISVCLVYWIVRRLQIPGALLAAAIFAVHPVYVESIAWITEQKNTLSVMFSLAAILAYLNFDENRRRETYAWALALFLLALLSKATAVTLPVALLVILWWQRGELSRERDLAPLAPWFALSLVVGAFTVWYEKVYVGVQGEQFVLSPVQKCLLASRAIWFYLGKLFWPATLTFIYPKWEINPTEVWQYIYVAGVIALIAAAWWIQRRTRAPLAALLFFLGTLFPLLGFFPTYIFSYTYVCDHFQYFPSLGIVVLVSATVALGLQRLSPTGRDFGRGLCVLVLGILALLTWQQSEMYGNIISLYETTIARNPTCWMPHNNLAGELNNIGQPQEAIVQCREALRLKPDAAEAFYNLATAQKQLGQLEDAAENYRQAIALRPNFPDALTTYGIVLGSLGRLPEAVDQFQQALALDPNYADAHSSLGLALFILDRPQEALEQFEAALRLQPDYAGAHIGLADVLVRLGRLQEAVDHYRLAVTLKPQFSDACFRLAKTYAQLQQTADAIGTAQHALELARIQGQTELQGKIQSWLNEYLAQQSKPHDVGQRGE